MNIKIYSNISKKIKTIFCLSTTISIFALFPQWLTSCKNNQNVDIFEYTLNNENCYTITTKPNYAKTFNEKIVIPSMHKGLPVNHIGDNFLSGYNSFNQIIFIPNNITQIGNNFLFECTSFNQPLVIPQSINLIGEAFMYCNDSYDSSIDICCDPSRFIKSDKSFSTNNPDAICYTKGIKVYSSYKFININTLINMFPSNTNYPYFRELISMPSFLEYTLNNDNMSYTVSTNFSNSYDVKFSFNSKFSIPSTYNNLTVDYIANDFLAGCVSFNQPIVIPNTITQIGDNFLFECTSFNQSLYISDNVTNIGNNFLMNCFEFNSDIYISKSIGMIPNGFLSGCTKFNKQVNIPESISYIGSNFLANCASFNQSLSIPKLITHIGQSFMYCNNSYTSTISLNCNVESFSEDLNSILSTNIGNADCYTQGIKIFSNQSSAEIIAILPNKSGENTCFRQLLFLDFFQFIPNKDNLSYTITTNFDNSIHNLATFNMKFDIPLTYNNKIITDIGDQFLANARSFNQPLVMPDTIKTVGSNFLDCCIKFDRPLTLSNSLTQIGDYFLYECTLFNQPIILADTITQIGDWFLYSCAHFNQFLILPNKITTIGDHFLSRCDSFNCDITLPNKLTQIGYRFMYNNFSFVRNICMECDVNVINNADQPFVSSTQYCDTYEQGFSISGNVENLTITNLNGPDYFRKFVIK